MKIKVCGMKYEENIKSVAALKPDYLGFIFYGKSKRNFEGQIPEIAADIKKAGVFVNASESFINAMIKEHGLDAVQLHGDETISYCLKIREANRPDLEIIKAFSISKEFNFKVLEDYMTACDYFLFDTKGKERGGNGTLFDWKLLKDYMLDKPFFLSGGIGPDEIEEVVEFLKTPMASYCYALDVNSKFETEPGMKMVLELKKFIELNAKEE